LKKAIAKGHSAMVTLLNGSGAFAPTPRGAVTGGSFAPSPTSSSTPARGSITGTTAATAPTVPTSSPAKTTTPAAPTTVTPPTRGSVVAATQASPAKVAAPTPVPTPAPVVNARGIPPAGVTSTATVPTPAKPAVVAAAPAPVANQRGIAVGGGSSAPAPVPQQLNNAAPSPDKSSSNATLQRSNSLSSEIFVVPPNSSLPELKSCTHELERIEKNDGKILIFTPMRIQMFVSHSTNTLDGEQRNGKMLKRSGDMA
jgi:hypothetical protein